MNDDLYFCDHAVKRLKTRTKMSDEMAHKLISKNNSLIIHTKLGVNGMRESRVFYSPVDYKFYVAVVESDTNEVVTILHSWQSREFRKVPRETLRVIKQKAIDFGSKFTDKKIKSKRSVIYVNLSYYKDNKKFKTLHLFKVMAEEYDHEIGKLITDRRFVMRIYNEIICREIPMHCVNAIVIKLGNRGDPNYYDFDGTNLTKYEIVR